MNSDFVAFFKGVGLIITFVPRVLIGTPFLIVGAIIELGGGKPAEATKAGKIFEYLFPIKM